MNVCFPHPENHDDAPTMAYLECEARRTGPSPSGVADQDRPTRRPLFNRVQAHRRTRASARPVCAKEMS